MIPGLTNQSGRGESRLINTNPQAPALSEQDQSDWLDILSLTEIGVDTLATYFPTPTTGTADCNSFKANFVSAISIACERVLSKNGQIPIVVPAGDMENLVPAAPSLSWIFRNMNENENENENVICDLSVGFSRRYSQTRTSRAIDLASDIYGYDHECFNSGFLGLERDKRVLAVGNPLINELVDRRDTYLSSTGMGVGAVSVQKKSTRDLTKGIKYKQD